ncbi:hypothetical protein KL925_003642 [Ogataea polymorpha]|nr:hypothetical protein KL925_003642 [Ogataea polymorpha]
MSTFDVEDVLKQLTTKEKVQLLSLKDFWHTQEIKRLNVPSIRLSDGPNGVRGTKFFKSEPSACFTSGTGMGSTFNVQLLKKVGSMMATEAKHKGAHVILGPTCNIQRGPLGGRGFESFSEDPFLSGLCSASLINGIQSKGIGATIKHYVCNDLEDERNSVDAIVSERALREIYLMPFQLAVKYSQPKCLMSSYNKVNGEHVSQSKKLLTGVLREEWGWNGLVMSDWFGVYSIKNSIDAGLDLECPGVPIMRKMDAVLHAINAREISIDVIDERVRNVLNLVKFSMQSGIPENAPEDSKNNVPETSALLKRLASEAIVLLKNKDSFLPLKKTDKIAVIGPNAKVPRIFGGGSASMNPYYATNIFDGIADKLTEPPLYADGCSIEKNLLDLGTLSTFNGSEGVYCKVYNLPAESSDRVIVDEFALNSTRLMLFDYKNDKLDNNLFYMDIEGEFTAKETGTYEISVSCLGTAQFFINGKLEIDDKNNQVLGFAALGASTAPKTKRIDMNKGESFKYKIEFGSSPTFTLETTDLVASNGGGALYVSAMKVESDKDRIKKAVEVASQTDKVVLCVGTSSDWESEGYDRPVMDLPGSQDELIQEVLKVNKNVVVVNLSGTPVTMPWVDEVPAIIQGWFNGSESGNAIADVIFGDVNPSGKLSLTFPKRCQDNPAYLTFKSNKGKVVYGEDTFVGYRYYEKCGVDPLFAFGFGLSYTTFAFSSLSVRVNVDTILASVEVKNTGTIAGGEVIQLYITPPSGTTEERPLKELKGFNKVFLESNEATRVEIQVPVKYGCSYFDGERKKWLIEKGTYGVLVGNASNSKTFLTSSFEIQESTYWSGL